MRIKEMVPVTGPELDDLFAALDATRVDVAAICGLSPHAPGRWRKSKKIPMAHMHRLAVALIAKLQPRSDDLKPFEKRAMAFVRTASALAEASGTALLYKKHGETSAFGDFTPDWGAVGALSNYKLEDLVAEVQRRGWKVELSLMSPPLPSEVNG